MKATIYKLLHHNIIIYYGASCIKNKSKILYDQKKLIINKCHQDKNIIEYFNNSINNIDDLKIFIIDYIDVKNRKELNNFIDKYRLKNQNFLFNEFIYCVICNLSINKKNFDLHLKSESHFNNDNNIKMNNYNSIINFINGF